jgi:hypothetical protein
VSRKVRVLEVPVALASDGGILVNASQLGVGQHDLSAIIENARATGLPVFVGVAVPDRLTAHIMADIDDALADVMGRLGPKLVRRWARR